MSLRYTVSSRVDTVITEDSISKQNKKQQKSTKSKNENKQKQNKTKQKKNKAKQKPKLKQLLDYHTVFFIVKGGVCMYVCTFDPNLSIVTPPPSVTITPHLPPFLPTPMGTNLPQHIRFEKTRHILSH